MSAPRLNPLFDLTHFLPILRSLSLTLASSPYLKNSFPKSRVFPFHASFPHLTNPFSVSRIFSLSLGSFPDFRHLTRVLSSFSKSPYYASHLSHPLPISRIISPSLCILSPSLAPSLCLPHHFPVFRSLSPSLASPPCPTHPSSSEESFPCLTNPLRVSRIFSRS